MKATLKKSRNIKYKFTAIFDLGNGKKKKVNFGAKGYKDFTTHKDVERKRRYLLRHKKKEDWTDPLTAGALSRFLLWNKTTIEASIKDYKKRFGISIKYL